MWSRFGPALRCSIIALAFLLVAREAPAQVPPTPVAGDQPPPPNGAPADVAPLKQPCGACPAPPAHPGIWLWNGADWAPVPSAVPCPPAHVPTPAPAPGAPHELPPAPAPPKPGKEVAPPPPGTGTTPPPQTAAPTTPPAMNQPIAAPELASAATTGAESLAMSSPSAFGDIFSTQPTHVVAMTGPAGHVPTPFITSATVAELKLVDNASPMPRDRIIFDYDMFNKVPLVAGGVGVNQYTAGFEKTLCDGRASVELRVPFATTLDANVDVGNTEGFGATNTHAVELGNVEIWTKALLYQDCTCAVSAGLGFVVPTASDSNVNMQDSLGGYVDVYRVVNRSTHLLPFVGCVWTPTERCFVQQFLQFDIDTIGNHVDVDNPNTGNLTSDGTLHSAPFVFYDISAGYWLWHEPPCSGRVVTGLAGIFEIHYNQALSHSNSVMIPSSAFFESDYHAIANTPYVDSIGDVMLGGDPAFSSVNLTFGLTAEICDDATLSAGYTLPVTQGIGKEFDGQLQVYFNYYFGRSSKSNRTGAASAPSTL